MSAGRSISSTAMMVLVGVLGLTVTVGVGALVSPASADTGDDLPPGYVETSSGPLGPADRDLLVRVRLAGLWEQPAGDMARENGTAKVKEIGTKISNEHHELDEQVRSVAATLGVKLPDVPNADQQGWLNEMTGKTGPALDQIFIDRLRAAHGKIFPAIANVRAGTRNSLIREFAVVANAAVMRHMGYLESSGIVHWSHLDLPPVPAGTPVDYRRRGGSGVNPLVIWLVLGIAAIAGLATTIRAVRLR